MKAGPWQLLTTLHLQRTGCSTSKAEPHHLRSGEGAGNSDWFIHPSRADSSSQTRPAGTCAPEPDTQGPQGEVQDTRVLRSHLQEDRPDVEAMRLPKPSHFSSAQESNWSWQNISCTLLPHAALTAGILFWFWGESSKVS